MVVPLQVVIGAQVYDEGRDGATPELVAEGAGRLRAGQHVASQPRGDGSRSTSGWPREGAERDPLDPPVGRDERHLRVRPARGQAGRRCRSRASTAGRSGRRPGTPRCRPPTSLDAGGSAAEAAEAARDRAAAATSLFYVDTLEYLRRGGRIGAAAAIFGGALSVKPLLSIVDGKVANLEKVRTGARALARLEDLAVEAAGTEQVDVYVAHLANLERAEQLAAKLAERLADNLGGREIWCGELGAVLGAHVGPGMVAVCVAPRLG